MRGGLLLCSPFLALLAMSSCGVDDRSLSFQLGLGSATGEGGDPSQGEPHAGEATGASAGQGSMTSNGGDSPENDGGAPGAGGAPGPTPTPGGAPGGGGEDTSSAGTSSAGTMSSGGTMAQAGTDSGGGGMGGKGGSGGDPNVEPGNFPCGNLNRNGVDDCVETLVKNSRFDTGASEWESEGSLLQSWKAENARGGSGSGSLSLLNTTVIPEGTGNVAQASHQCIVAWGGDQFDIGARVLIASGQGNGKVGVNLILYGSDDCDGTVLGGKDVAFTSETDHWVVVRNTLTIPAGTRSARVRLMVAKPFPQASLQAQFDDVLVVKL